MRRAALILVCLSALSVTVACGGGTSSVDKTMTAEAGKPTATTGTRRASAAVNVAAKDFAFTLDKSAAPAGDVTFTVRNAGPTEHEFVIFKTDLAADKLPLVTDKSKVDEAGAGVKHIDEIESFASGATKSLAATLDAGKYVFVCNLPAHYSQGMYVVFTVQ